MEISRIEGCTRTIGESQGYLGLPLRDIVINCTVNGLNTPAMETAWRPNVEDIDAMVGGAPIVLRILGTQHPPVMLTVTPRRAEEIAAAETKAAQLKEIDKATNPAAFAGSDDELAQTAAMLENMAEASFPATDDGKCHFARVIMETAAQCIRAHLKATDDVRPRVAECAKEYEAEARWLTCSGCYDTEDGQPTANYPFSAAFGCTLGNGCSECGGIGAVWDTTDYEEMAKHILADDEPSALSPSSPKQKGVTDAARVYPDIATPAVHDVLTLMNFRTIPIAHALRAGGEVIPAKTEEEQAFVLHWMLKLALDHPGDWKDRVGQTLEEISIVAKSGK